MSEQVHVITDAPKKSFLTKKTTILGASAIFIAGALLLADDVVKRFYGRQKAEDAETIED